MTNLGISYISMLILWAEIVFLRVNFKNRNRLLFILYITFLFVAYLIHKMHIVLEYLTFPIFHIYRHYTF